MSSERKCWNHCKEFVTLRTYRPHADLYSNRASEVVYSSEEEEISRDDSEDFYHAEHVEPCSEREVIDDHDQETKQHLQVLKCLFVSGS